MIKGAIFDFDGTLYDSMSIWNTMGSRYAESIGIVPRANINEDFKKLSILKAAEFFQTEYGVKLPAEEIVNSINSLAEKSYMHEAAPKKGIPEFLAELEKRGAAMCIATATDKYLIEAALERFGLRKYFKGIITCTDVKCGKNKPVIYREALKITGTEKKDTYVFEDFSMAAETAHRDGFKVVGIYDAYESFPEEVKRFSDFYITDYTKPDGFWEFVSE